MIKAGDLVMIAKLTPCCGNGSLGYSFIVEKVTVIDAHCPFCFAPHDNIGVTHSGSCGYLAINRLIKIDPPAIPEAINEKLEITA